MATDMQVSPGETDRQCISKIFNMNCASSGKYVENRIHLSEPSGPCVHVPPNIAMNIDSRDVVFQRPFNNLLCRPISQY